MKILLNKIFFLIIVISILTFQTCNDTINTPTIDSAIKVLNGKIKNYDFEGETTLKMEKVYIIKSNEPDSIVVFDTTTVNSDGTFSILLTTPPDFLLSSRNGIGCTGFILSNDSIRTFPYTAFRLYKNSIHIGNVFCTDNPETPFNQVGKYIGILMFSEGQLNITGDCISTSENFKSISKAKINLQKGWNQIIATVLESTDSTYIIEQQVDNNFNVNWWLQSSN